MILSLSGLGTTTADIQAMITASANQYGIPPSLALAVATKESSLNPNAIGTSGEIGVFQLMPATAAGLGVNPSNLQQNIDGGTRLLSQLYNQYGDWYQALAAYNEGPTALSQHGVYPSTDSYATSILAASGIDSAPMDSGSIDAASSDGSSGFSFSSPVVLAGAALGLVALFAFSR